MHGCCDGFDVWKRVGGFWYFCFETRGGICILPVAARGGNPSFLARVLS